MKDTVTVRRLPEARTRLRSAEVSSTSHHQRSIGFSPIWPSRTPWAGSVWTTAPCEKDTGPCARSSRRPNNTCRMQGMPTPSHRTQLSAPGYPSSYESVVGLADGRRVEIRPILPSDTPKLVEAIRTADAQTLHSRFLGGPPRLTDTVLDGLTQVDYLSRFALVARSRGRGVAVARYALQPSPGVPAVAEVAVAVAPQWRRVGLGSALVQLLAHRAQECGITDFTAMFLAENRPVTELAHDGHARVVIAQGVAQLYATLRTPHQDRPSHDRSEEPRQ